MPEQIRYLTQTSIDRDRLERVAPEDLQPGDEILVDSGYGLIRKVVSHIDTGRAGPMVYASTHDEVDPEWVVPPIGWRIKAQG